MRDEILQVAQKQFLKFGIRQITVQKLIEPLGISTKTVYKYFKNKEELLEEVSQLSYAQLYQPLEERSIDDNVVALLLEIWYMAASREYKVNNVFFEDLHNYYPELEAKIEVEIGKKFTKKLTQIIQKGIEEAMFRDDIIPELVMESIYVLYIVTVRTEQFRRFGASPFDVLLNTIVVFIRGFCTAKGVKELDKHVQLLEPFGKAIRIKEKTAVQL